MAQEPDTGSRNLALDAAKLVLEKKGLDLNLLEVGKISIVADYFLLVTGTTVVQVHAIADHLLESLKKSGLYALRVEGYREGWWVVLDYGGLVIHIFQTEARTFYDLDRLWSGAPKVPLDQLQENSFLSLD